MAAAATLSPLLSALLLTALALLLLHLLAAAGWWLFDRLMDPMLERSRDALRQEQLLRILELMLTRRPVSPDTNRRRNMESLVAAHERLWQLRHAESPGP
jgi:hypothetical protein